MKTHNNRKKSLSIEVCPPQNNKKCESFLKNLESLDQLSPDYISCRLDNRYHHYTERNLEICKTIKENGRSIPVMHLTCLNQTKEQLSDQLNEFKAHGIDHFLAIRGSVMTGIRKSQTEFSSTAEFVRYIKKVYPDSVISVSGYPEKHLEATTIKEDIENLRKKQNSGADYVITQICYDMNAYGNWIEKIRTEGITLPLNVGILPVLNADRVLKLGFSNGISFPKELVEIFSRYGDSPIEFKKAGIDYTIGLINKIKTFEIRGLHFFYVEKYQDLRLLLNEAAL